MNAWVLFLMGVVMEIIAYNIDRDLKDISFFAGALVLQSMALAVFVENVIGR